MTDPRKPLLIVEDDPALQTQMKWAFDGYEVVVASDRESALAQLRRVEPAVVTLDLGLPPAPDDPSEGLRTLQDILALAPQTKVIVLTGQSDRGNAMKVIALGAYDFYAKPFEPEVLALIIERAFRLHELQEENRRLHQAQSGALVGGIITRDPETQRLCRTIEKIAPSNVTAMVLGESGTGKELVARALHELSPRASRRFVAINCAAIPDALLESELFGHEKGAFTGAVKQTIGKIETANKGTLFLDEIGDLPLPLQAKLLRFLQERSIERIGGREEIPVDVRVVCATHRDLKALIREGRFREDLYYRLAEIVLVAPPLRERVADATLIAHALVHRFAAELKRGAMQLAPDALEAIEKYSWPGNVRELENVIKRAIVMAEGKSIRAAELDLGALGGEIDDATEPLNLRAVREAAEHRAVLRALARSNNNLSRAAELLGISRPTLYDLLNRFGLKPSGVALTEDN
ncbi:MAG: PEP-CTERM-box response regulator transcription factor [Burkholderiaceae bacterium]|nr:PEP-CTERM-box response regulator transcription factor [Burkholderiaceae bacterium]